MPEIKNYQTPLLLTDMEKLKKRYGTTESNKALSFAVDEVLGRPPIKTTSKKTETKKQSKSEVVGDAAVLGEYVPGSAQTMDLSK